MVLSAFCPCWGVAADFGMLKFWTGSCCWKPRVMGAPSLTGWRSGSCGDGQGVKLAHVDMDGEFGVAAVAIDGA